MIPREGRMELEVGLTLLVGEETVLEVRDNASRIQFLAIRLNPQQLALLLGRRAELPCRAEIAGLAKIGLRMEHRSLEAPLPRRPDWTEREAVAAEAINAVCPEGWEPDHRYGSQGSFFERDGEPWCRTPIRRWVRPETVNS